MKQYKRKLQFVAGSTYSVSLPKEWVKGFNLKPQQELNLAELDNGLLVSSEGINVFKKEMSINVDDCVNTVEQTIVAVYYYGVSDLSFYSRGEISSEFKMKVREIITELPGAEIVYEDKKKMSVKIMFDDLNIDLFQVFYRINLLIESSIENITHLFDWNEIKMNEDEVDRLYHLATKIITTSMKNRGILQSSKIENSIYIPSLFLISKRLENIADNLRYIAKFVEKDKVVLKESKPILEKVQRELERSILYLMGKRKKKFVSMGEEFYRETKAEIKKIDDGAIGQLVKEVLRYIWNIQEEVVTISFYDGIKN